MFEMFEKNSVYNILISLSIFLFAINFMHYGQLFLLIACFVALIKERKNIRINNTIVLVILCLFAISFLLFSYKLGIYCVIGFFVPVAYLLGSNLRIKDEKSLKWLIYLLTLGMCAHVLLNFYYDFYRLGIDLFTKHSHHDFWTKESVAATQTAVNFTFIIGCIYYLLNYEKEKKIKATGILLFILLSIYNIALGRRTPALLTVIALVVPYLIDVIILKNKKINIVKIVTVFSAFLLICAFVFYYIKDNKEIIDYILTIRIIDKFLWQGLNPMRISIFIEALKIAPQHPWGGTVISTTIGLPVHDIIMDTYDYAGVVTTLFLVIYLIYCIVIIKKALKKKTLSREFKLMLFTLFMCIGFQMMLEPIMTGSSIFMLSFILVQSSLESVKNE